MALIPSSASSPSLGYPVTEKLAKNKFPLWRAQVMSALRTMSGFIDGSTPAPEKMVPKSTTEAELVANPAFAQWEVRDQQVLNYLLSSLSSDILLQVVSSMTAREAWVAIDTLFASQSRARVISTRLALATAHKGTSNVTDYFGRMKTLTDEMASAGKKLEDEEFVSYILAGLDMDFNPLVSAIAARVEPIFLGELFNQLTSFEQRMDLLQGNGSGSSANMA
ncbi:unnamed protein product [Urochloa humidicola]